MKVAIIGCSGMGAHHAQMVSQCGLNIAACGDYDLKCAKKLAKQFGAKASKDCLEVIRRPDVDIACIATPTPTHKDYVIAAAKAGKHIFCEKPLARTVADCERALAAVEKAGVKLYVGHVVRFFQEFEAIRAQVDSGKIGKAGFVKMYRGGICPVGSGKWFHDFEQSGGVTFDCSIHDFDWLRYMFGEVDHVFSQNVPRTKPAPMDYALTTLKMKSGLLAHVIGTWAHPSGFRVKVEVCGESGIVQFDSEEAPLNLQRRTKPGEGPGMIIPASPVDVSPYRLEWEDFIGWIEGRHEPRVTGEDGLAAVRIASAAMKSAASGKPVQL
jgi:UDP-N-acetylglucosamine 3-dehydrogenase